MIDYETVTLLGLLRVEMYVVGDFDCR